MKMYLTEGMFGNKVKQIGEEQSSFVDMLKVLQKWKEEKTNKALFKIEKYDRILFENKNHEVAIDFGDYYNFMLVTDVPDNALKEVK